MADQQRPGEASAIGIADDDDLAFEAPDRGSAEELLDAGARAPLDSMRHSAAHVMAEAVLALFPGARLGIGPAIADGFYYDFELPRPLTHCSLNRYLPCLPIDAISKQTACFRWPATRPPHKSKDR